MGLNAAKSNSHVTFANTSAIAFNSLMKFLYKFRFPMSKLNTSTGLSSARLF